MNIYRCYMGRITTICILHLLFIINTAKAQHSVARQWNEVLLEAIRNDLARPTVHARNLFHVSAAMYDAWAVYDRTAKPYFLGDTVGNIYFPFNGLPQAADIKAAQEKAMSYAAYRIIKFRFIASPGWVETFTLADSLMDALGFDPLVTSMNYTDGDPAKLGNYIAQKIIEFGLQDGSNERRGYGNAYYEPVNDPMILSVPGSQHIIDPNRWQPLTFVTFIDQSGNEIPAGTPEFLSPEWGNVVPFSLRESDRTTYIRDGNEYNVYYDPGPPSYTDANGSGSFEDYEWGFSLVSYWSAHLNARDSVLWDISPASIGNIDFADLPEGFEGLRSFYNEKEGGDISKGYRINPVTGTPYEPQVVPRGDYTRVLAEFWADGPDSETPPGHWYTILNYVNDHPELRKKFRGEGQLVDDLEWDIKSYFILGGAMHDVAISAWSIKGYYDYIRPISAIRHMADLGQSSNDSLDNYHPAGIKLEPGLVEIVAEGDPLAGDSSEHIGKIKVFAWRGHDFIVDATTDEAGTGWILAENWWPYQRPSFVTPPFAGYVSGHSTYSRAAAKVLTLLTGDKYFPGGMGEFQAPKDSFLKFEKGPNTDVVLQWATYYDASDQCSLSRIWGGIHPPVDDISGRLIGDRIGQQAFDYALSYFERNTVLSTEKFAEARTSLYPNPVMRGDVLRIRYGQIKQVSRVKIVSVTGKVIYDMPLSDTTVDTFSVNTDKIPAGLYVILMYAENKPESHLVRIY